MKILAALIMGKETLPLKVCAEGTKIYCDAGRICQRLFGRKRQIKRVKKCSGKKLGKINNSRSKLARSLGDVYGDECQCDFRRLVISMRRVFLAKHMHT